MPVMTGNVALQTPGDQAGVQPFSIVPHQGRILRVDSTRCRFQAITPQVPSAFPLVKDGLPLLNPPKRLSNVPGVLVYLLVLTSQAKETLLNPDLAKSATVTESPHLHQWSVLSILTARGPCIVRVIASNLNTRTAGLHTMECPQRRDFQRVTSSPMAQGG